MDTYRIEWKRSATKELRSLPTHMVQRIVEAVTQLSVNPFPLGVRKLCAEQCSRAGWMCVIGGCWKSSRGSSGKDVEDGAE